ncbi:hypothetical protein VDGD_21507 [Verticillium dahliae]|nr:hypothetical protein VDGD_21507 [Verticillium dahliae]
MSRRQYIPASCIALQVLALALQKACADLLAGEVILTGVVDLVGRPHRNLRVDKVVVLLDKVSPLGVLGHGNGADAELVDGVVRGVRLALENAGIGVVRLLDLADDDGLKLPAGRLQVEVRLVQVVLLIDLALHLPVDSETQEVGVLLAGRGGRVRVALANGLLQRLDQFARGVHLLLDRVLEVARQALDLLDLLVQVTAESCQGQDDVLLDLSGLVRLDNGVLVVDAQDLHGIHETA